MTAWPRLLMLAALLLAACAAPREAPEDARVAFTPAATAGSLSALTLGIVDGDSLHFATGVLTGKHDMYTSLGALAGPGGEADVDPQQIPADLGRALGSRFKAARKAATAAEAAARGDDVVVVIDIQVKLGAVSFDTTSVTVTGTFQGLDGTVISKAVGNGRHELPYPATSFAFRPAWVAALADFMNRVDGISADIASLGTQHRGAPPAATSIATARATAAPPMAALPAAQPPPPRFPAQPVVAHFPRGPERSDDVAVIVGNADYSRQGKDIPDAKPAYADAEGMRLYATQTLGIREGNVIFLRDATGAQMIRVFGSDKDYRGQLYDWIRPGKSRVFVYYSGHGAPATQGGSPYLIPVDADAARIELSGYPLKTLYDNLGRLPAEHVTVVLEACFSGVSPAGSVLGKASPVFFEVKAPPVPANLTVITAGAANQMASWEQDEASGLFTKYFLKGMAGEADADKDGRVTLDELDHYLKDTLTYWARRYYGRDQTAQIVTGGGR